MISNSNTHFADFYLLMPVKSGSAVTVNDIINDIRLLK